MYGENIYWIPKIYGGIKMNEEELIKEHEKLKKVENRIKKIFNSYKKMTGNEIIAVCEFLLVDLIKNDSNEGIALIFGRDLGDFMDIELKKIRELKGEKND